MASSKYRYSGNSKAKWIIIGCAAAAAAVIGLFSYLAIKADEENRLAALRYDFNKYYPSTFNYLESIDSTSDIDNDGFTNSEENIHKTSLINADTDGDGILDSHEAKHGTDPLRSDSDADEITDGIEILSDLDALSPISDGMTKDIERRFKRSIHFDEGWVMLTGDANIFGATVESLSLNAVSSNAGAITLPYEFFCADGLERAVITFRYDASLVRAYGIDEMSMKIFKFDPYSKGYSDVGGQVDTVKKTVSCVIEGNGVYVLGADAVLQSSIIEETEQLNVYFLIDNSGSMYPKSIQSTSKENDVNFKRLTFAERFVSEVQNGAKVAISAFTFDFKKLIDFSDDKSKVIESIERIRDLGAGFDGTSVERALTLALEEFTEEQRNDKNIIVLLTDGISTDTAGYTLDSITALAKKKNVTVMTVSLGNEIDRELLQNVASRTGGKYFPISEAKILEGLYSTVLASMQDDIVDEDFDGRPDSYTLYDTGFDPDTNGFSFGNFKSKFNETVDFGMAALARDWFKSSVRRYYNSTDPDLSYTLEGTTMSTSEPLRKVILGCMQAKWVKPDNYLDFNSPAGTLGILAQEEKDAGAMGWSVFTAPYEASGKWMSARYLYPDHTSNDLRTKYSENDYQMIRAILLYDRLRRSDKEFTLNDENDLDDVKRIMETGTPVVTKITWEDNRSCYSRYVLLTTLRRDLENPNIFKMKVYDVNSESPNTIMVYRTLRLSDTGKTDGFTYSAQWNGFKASIAFSTATIEDLKAIEAEG